MYLIENQISIELINFLAENNILDYDEKITSVEKPGEGNMNQVLRITTNSRTFILKQSRDFVNKYPQIEAPIERIFVEAAFYQQIAENSFLKSKMPQLQGFFPENYLIVLEDLGQNSDFLSIYQQDSEISENEIMELTSFINQLHRLNIKQYPSNDELKKLNHFHIFDFPFQQDNGFNLDSVQQGLQAISLPYKSDEILKNKIVKLGEIYLETGEILIHGDYYPGSWLKTAGGIKIIDPEFGYLGKAEFDIGVFIAHLYMARKGDLESKIFNNYANRISQNLVYAFAGVEILRRILGVAQLPLCLTVEEKSTLLEKAKSFIINYDN